ncbi:MAG: hypothetical protein LBQ12_03755 [Deltaproteobacteria bacterium]|nr:hypothetical protein [Deltaproteobacteria bacterium]
MVAAFGGSHGQQIIRNSEERSALDKIVTMEKHRKGYYVPEPFVARRAKNIPPAILLNYTMPQLCRWATLLPALSSIYFGGDII